MKTTFKFLTIVVISLFTISLASCTSKSGAREERKARIETQTELNNRELTKTKNQNLDKEVLSDMDSLFLETEKKIEAFVSKYDNFNNSYIWTSIKKSDRHYPNLRLSGLFKDCILFTKRSKDWKKEIYYEVERTTEGNKSSFNLKRGLWRNGEELESKKQFFTISTKAELEAALEPILRRLNEAQQDVKKNVSRIKIITADI